jgi:hypothetical protein
VLEFVKAIIVVLTALTIWKKKVLKEKMNMNGRHALTARERER